MQAWTEQLGFHFCGFALSALCAFWTELALWLRVFFLGVAYFQRTSKGAGKESDKESGMTDGEMGIETLASYITSPQGLPYQLRMDSYGRRWWLASRTEQDVEDSPWLRLWKSVQSIRKKHVITCIHLFLIEGCGQPDRAREVSRNDQRFQMQATRSLRWHDFIRLLGSRKTSISEQPDLKMAFQQTILVLLPRSIPVHYTDPIRVWLLLSLRYCWLVNITRSIWPVLSSHALILHMSLLSPLHNRLSIWQWDTEICAVQGCLSWVHEVFYWRLLQETKIKARLQGVLYLWLLYPVAFQFLPRRCNTFHLSTRSRCSTISG